MDDKKLLFPAFARVACALDDAGVQFLADGDWYREQQSTGRPRWDGCFNVPCTTDTMVRALAALEAIDYRPARPVDPQIYGDPNSVPGMDGELEADDPANLIDLEFIPRAPETVPVCIEVDPPDYFAQRYRRGRVEHVGAGLSVHRPDIAWVECGHLLDLERRCPQSLPHVVVEDFVARRRAGEFAPDAWGPALPWPHDRLPPLLFLPPRWPDVLRDPGGISFDVYEKLVRAMNLTGPRYILNGAWWIEEGWELELLWDGDLTVARQLDSLQDAFRSLAAPGFAPDPVISAEEFAAWQPDPGEVNDAFALELIPMAHFFSTAHLGARVRVVAPSPAEFDDDWDLAEIQELAPGMPVLTRDPVNEGMAYSACPQSLSHVRELDRVVRESNELGRERASGCDRN